MLYEVITQHADGAHGKEKQAQKNKNRRNDVDNHGDRLLYGCIRKNCEMATPSLLAVFQMDAFAAQKELGRAERGDEVRNNFV